MNKNEILGKPKNAKTHGLSKTRLYTIWHSMKCRCHYPATNQYKNYGGRGIEICDEWEKGFLPFYNWAMSNGYKDDLTLDRINVNGNYEPSNCKWSTKKEQGRNTTANRFITYKGETKTLTEWCEIYNINIVTLSDRLKTGMTFEEAVSKPVYKSGGFLTYTINGETKMITDWCKIYNISYVTVYNRIKRNWDIFKALTTPPKRIKRHE